MARLDAQGIPRGWQTSNVHVRATSAEPSVTLLRAPSRSLMTTHRLLLRSCKLHLPPTVGILLCSLRLQGQQQRRTCLPATHVGQATTALAVVAAAAPQLGGWAASASADWSSICASYGGLQRSSAESNGRNICCVQQSRLPCASVSPPPLRAPSWSSTAQRKQLQLPSLRKSLLAGRQRLPGELSALGSAAQPPAALRAALTAAARRRHPQATLPCSAAMAAAAAAGAAHGAGDSTLTWAFERLVDCPAVPVHVLTDTLLPAVASGLADLPDCTRARLCLRLVDSDLQESRVDETTLEYLRELAACDVAAQADAALVRPSPELMLQVGAVGAGAWPAAMAHPHSWGLSDCSSSCKQSCGPQLSAAG